MMSNASTPRIPTRGRNQSLFSVCTDHIRYVLLFLDNFLDSYFSQLRPLITHFPLFPVIVFTSCPPSECHTSSESCDCKQPICYRVFVVVLGQNCDVTESSFCPCRAEMMHIWIWTPVFIHRMYLTVTFHLFYYHILLR